MLKKQNYTPLISIFKCSLSQNKNVIIIVKNQNNEY